MKDSCYQDSSVIHGWFGYWVFDWEMCRLSKSLEIFGWIAFKLYTHFPDCGLLSLYMFQRIILILLIVISLFRNFNRCAACFQSNINIAWRRVLKMPRVNIKRFLRLHIPNHKWGETKAKHNKFSNVLKPNTVNIHSNTWQLALKNLCLSKVRTRPAGRIRDVGNFLIVFTKNP